MRLNRYIFAAYTIFVYAAIVLWASHLPHFDWNESTLTLLGFSGTIPAIGLLNSWDARQ